MSFPLSGNDADVENWLRTNSFTELTIKKFADWDTKAMLGVSEAVVMRRAGDEGYRLWALLTTERNRQGKFRKICQPADSSTTPLKGSNLR